LDSAGWAHSGRELFFVDGNRELVSQAVLPGETFQRGEQHVLFAIGSSYRVGPNHTAFDISPDNRRFLMVREKGAGVEEAPRLIVVENQPPKAAAAFAGTWANSVANRRRYGCQRPPAKCGSPADASV